MAKNDYEGEVVATGTWVYAGKVKSTIYIVAFDCDYFYERMPADDGRREWKPYSLAKNGLLYYLKPESGVMPIKPFSSISEAQNWAGCQAWGPIDWDAG